MKSLTDGLKSIFGLVSGRAGRPAFKAMFALFRRVLDRHNNALEIIADMGDKLGGDYIFDINYIKKAYDELYSEISFSLSDFNVLTGSRYSSLKDIFDSIDTNIRRLIYDIGPQSPDMVMFYDDITWDRTREVGGKMANLAELRKSMDIIVPDAFAVTTRAFDEFLKHNSIDEKIRQLRPGSPDMRPQLKEIQDLVLAGAFPSALDNAIDKAVEKLKGLCQKDCLCAVRSSAEEEDSGFSFAGQFETVLNVPLDRESVKEAYKKVIASLYSEKAVVYQLGLGYDINNSKMAVACMLMVDAVSSGVIYSVDPAGSERELVINSTWGLGKSIVEGQTDADLYIVGKTEPPVLLSGKTGRKQEMVIRLKDRGTDTVGTPAVLAGEESLKESEIIGLSRLAILIEKKFRRPVDIEWAIDSEGRKYILQARPLIAPDTEKTAAAPPGPVPDALVLLKAEGTVVQRGAGAGKVFIIKNSSDLDAFPRGAVLVAKHDSSDYIRVMPFTSAIITDTGTPTSHMSALCREFRVPTFVNAGNATELLQHGQKITVIAGDNGTLTVYDGTIRELLGQGSDARNMERLYEFRKKRYILRYISMLNLIDPLLDDFVPEKCRTMHDILRFIHEKSVMELIETARYGPAGNSALKLDIPIPVGITVVDIGGGISQDAEDGKERKITFDQISSIPFRAIIQGMMRPGAWHSETVSLKAGDFMASMMRMPDITSAGDSYVGYNVAVISREYANLSLRFGYHFNMMDCLCSENTRNNHIYFRFAGGATDITKRSRRVQLIAAVLKDYAFNIKIKGDLLIARLSNISMEEMGPILDMAGRLIAYTRQLDAVLHDDSKVEKYAMNFKKGVYDL